jgi:dTDP-4-dehydrorhamnose 3,5-epimerase-like enzyme
MAARLLKRIEVLKFIDERGNLGVSEFGLNEKFLAKRLYYITDVPKDVTRGGHGHKNLEQIFFAVSGSFQLTVSDGNFTEKVQLRALQHGYFLPAGLWRDLDNFSSDCVCLVLASQAYDPSDYIHSFEEFLVWRNSK